MQSRKDEIIAFERQSGIRALGLRRLWNNLLLTGGNTLGLGDDCVICAKVMDDENALLQCPTCKHKFHRTCICRWVKVSPNRDCPMCRSKFENNFCSKKRKRVESRSRENLPAPPRLTLNKSFNSVGDNGVFSPDGRFIALSKGRKICMLDWRTGEKSEFNTHLSRVVSFSFSPDGTKLAGAYPPSGNNLVKIWNVIDGIIQQPGLTLEGHSDYVRSVSFSPDGTKIASGSFDKTIKLWDVTSGECLQTLKGHSRPVTSVSFSPDGTKVASGSWDKTVKIWDVEGGRCRLTLKGHEDWINALSFSPDGTKLVSCGHGSDRNRTGMIIIWGIDEVDGDVYKHEENLHSRLDRFPSPVELVAFSPVNNSTIAVGCRNGMGWYLHNGRRYMFRAPNDKYVETLAFSPDGRLLACGDSYDELGLWNVM